MAPKGKASLNPTAPSAPSSVANAAGSSLTGSGVTAAGSASPGTPAVAPNTGSLVEDWPKLPKLPASKAKPAVAGSRAEAADTAAAEAPPAPPAPASGAAFSAVLKCDICGYHLKGGAAALRAHKENSARCLAAQGLLPGKGAGRSACPYGCGKFLATHDSWALEQHAWFCTAFSRSGSRTPSRQHKDPRYWLECIGLVIAI